VHRDGQRRALLLVVLEQLAVVERGEHVAVDDDEASLEVGHHGECPSRAERLALPVEGQPNLGRYVRVRQIDQDELTEVIHA
jgi:hypothetical protein